MKKRLLVFSILSLLTLSVGLTACSNNSKDKTTASEKDKTEIIRIEKEVATIKKENDSTKKLEKLKDFEEKADEYDKGEKVSKNVTAAYTKGIIDLKAEFIEANNRAFDATKVEDVAKADKDALKGRVSALNTLKEKATKQKTIVYSEKELNDYTTKVDARVKEYSDQVAKLEEADKNAIEATATEEQKIVEQQVTEQSQSAANADTVAEPPYDNEATTDTEDASNDGENTNNTSLSDDDSTQNYSDSGNESQNGYDFEWHFHDENGNTTATHDNHWDTDSNGNVTGGVITDRDTGESHTADGGWNFEKN